jgi:hypothetical protein
MDLGLLLNEGIPMFIMNCENASCLGVSPPKQLQKNKNINKWRSKKMNTCDNLYCQIFLNTAMSKLDIIKGLEKLLNRQSIQNVITLENVEIEVRTNEKFDRHLCKQFPMDFCISLTISKSILFLNKLKKIKLI